MVWSAAGAVEGWKALSFLQGQFAVQPLPARPLPLVRTSSNILIYQAAGASSDLPASKSMLHSRIMEAGHDYMQSLQLPPAGQALPNMPSM